MALTILFAISLVSAGSLHVKRDSMLKSAIIQMQMLHVSSDHAVSHEFSHIFKTTITVFQAVAGLTSIITTHGVAEDGPEFEFVICQRPQYLVPETYIAPIEKSYRVLPRSEYHFSYTSYVISPDPRPPMLDA